jgi:hypothetical protein
MDQFLGSRPLGQSNSLARYIDVEGSREYVEEMKQGFARISSRIYAFRDDIREFFQSAQLSRLVDSAPTGVPSEVLAVAAEFEREQVRLQGFSDSVVAYVPLGTRYGATLYRVGAMLISVASTMLFSMARGAMVRGAIDASWAMELSDREVYGPALMRAYHEESNADWPRVVVGDGVQKLWRSSARRTEPSPNDLMNVVFAKVESMLCFKDVDGKLSVDYLGSNMREFLRDGVDDLPALIDAAQVELERQLAIHEDDSKIQSKLQATLNYFESWEGPLNPARRGRAKTYERLRLEE